LSDLTTASTPEQSLERVSKLFELNQAPTNNVGRGKMVVLSPLLDLAGFYQPPFEIETETPIRISAEDDGVIVRQH